MKWALFFTVSSVSPPPFLPLHALFSIPCVSVSVVTDDTEAVASCSHCRWQIREKKGTGREESLANGVGHFDREKPWLVWTNRKGHKLWQCSNVPFTELHSPLFKRPAFTSAKLSLKKKNVMPFYFFKGCTRGSHKQGGSELFITLSVHLCSRDREGLSVIWQHLPYFFPLAALLEWPLWKCIQFWKKLQQRLIPWCSVMQAGSPSGGARQQYG